MNPLASWPRPPPTAPIGAPKGPSPSTNPRALPSAPPPAASSRTPWAINLRAGDGDGADDSSPSAGSLRSTDTLSSARPPPGLPGAAAPAPAPAPTLLSPRRVAAADVPREYLCGLTGRVMRDPVVLADGLSYEKAEVEAWLRKGERTSPATREPLAHAILVPNAALRSLIRSDPRCAAAADGGVDGAAARLAVAAPFADAPRADRAALRPGGRIMDDPRERQIRFVEGPAPAPKPDSPKAQGTIEWFISKPELQGYGEISPDGGLERILGKVWVWESTLGRVVPKSGSRVAFLAEPGVDNKGDARTVATEINFLHMGSESPRSISEPPSRRAGATPSEGPRRTGTPRNNKLRLRGSCTWFSNKFGFLRPDDGSADVFVHATAVEHLPGGEVRAGDYCEFRVATYGGRDRAVDVTLLQSADAGGLAAQTPASHRPVGQELAAHETAPYAVRSFPSFFPSTSTFR